jgi:hypothetical protein
LRSHGNTQLHIFHGESQTFEDRRVLFDDEILSNVSSSDDKSCNSIRETIKIKKGKDND